MFYKLFIFLVGAVAESIAKEHLKGICGKNYKTKTKFLAKENIIEQQLKDKPDWLWDTRNRMYLFQLNEKEHKNDYCPENHH